MNATSPPVHAGVILSTNHIQFDPELSLRGGGCADCGAAAFPCPELCPNCLIPMAPRLLGRRGVLYTYSAIHSGPAGRNTPYTVGYVDLPDGARVFAHIDGPAAALEPDMAVQIRVVPQNDSVCITWTPEGDHDA
uniref:ChsH2 C-terminal OB-fold domain-containing protein n=1 Tax=Mycolicibacterium brisbanense TaxID=146020 RepID=B8R4J0_9MYCO|nr:hypothetical protein [Mycolicibacterium brisbanense]